MLPPPLMWLPSVTDSLSRALGCSASYHLRSTVNPLIYDVEFLFSEPQRPKMMMRIWNIIQMYAARNDAVTSTMDAKTDYRLVVPIGIKRRFGSPKDETP